jgi:hypothetical protein
VEEGKTSGFLLFPPKSVEGMAVFPDEKRKRAGEVAKKQTVPEAAH